MNKEGTGTETGIRLDLKTPKTKRIQRSSRKYLDYNVLGRRGVGKAREVNIAPRRQALAVFINDSVLNHENSERPSARLEKYSWLKCEEWIMLGDASTVFARHFITYQ